jgi:hypothetical protein
MADLARRGCRRPQDQVAQAFEQIDRGLRGQGEEPHRQRDAEPRASLVLEIGDVGDAQSRQCELADDEDPLASTSATAISRSTSTSA